MPTDLPEKDPMRGRPMIPKDPKSPIDGFLAALICIGCYVAISVCDASAFTDEYQKDAIRGYLLTFMAAAACIIWKDSE